MIKSRKKIIRITTVPISMEILLKGQLRFMSRYFDVIGVTSNDQDKIDEISSREGIPIIPIDMSRAITPFKDLIALYKLYKLFKEHKPDIVHTHTPKAGTLGMIASKMAGVPIRLHTIAGLPLLEANGGKRKLLDIVEKLTYACSTMIYPNSYELNKVIQGLRYTSVDKLHVIGNGSSNGINTSYFDSKLFEHDSLVQLKNELGIRSNDTTFIFVGRLVTDKGINELVKAFVDINKRNVDTKLILVGSYEVELDALGSEIVSLIESNASIISVGFQNDVRPYLAISDVLTFPSYREGFPNVVMQAGAMGLPSIVTDINGCNEIVIEGENGLIIPVKNIDALNKAMLTLLNSKETRETLKRNSRKMIIERFEQQYVWNELLKEYQKRLKHN